MQRVRVIAVHRDGRKWQDYGQFGAVIGEQDGLIAVELDSARGLTMYYRPDHLVPA